MSLGRLLRLASTALLAALGSHYFWPASARQLSAVAQRAAPPVLVFDRPAPSSLSFLTAATGGPGAAPPPDRAADGSGGRFQPDLSPASRAAGGVLALGRAVAAPPLRVLDAVTAATGVTAGSLALVRGLRPGDQVDSLVVYKTPRRLLAYVGTHLAGVYPVSLGDAPDGPKVAAGDHRTPEGLYHIDGRNPNSSYHRGLHLSYPNAADRARAQSLGVSPGGDVMIHGLPNGVQGDPAPYAEQDWTFGCIALSNRDIDALWAATPLGTPVRIAGG